MPLWKCLVSICACRALSALTAGLSLHPLFCTTAEIKAAGLQKQRSQNGPIMIIIITRSGLQWQVLLDMKGRGGGCNITPARRAAESARETFISDNNAEIIPHIFTTKHQGLLYVDE